MIKITYILIDKKIDCRIEWDDPKSEESKEGFFVWALVDMANDILTEKQKKKDSR